MREGENMIKKRQDVQPLNTTHFDRDQKLNAYNDTLESQYLTKHYSPQSATAICQLFNRAVSVTEIRSSNQAEMKRRYNFAHYITENVISPRSLPKLQRNTSN